MKKGLILYLIVSLLMISSLLTEELGDFYPGRLNVCFSSTGIRSRVGEIEIRNEDGIVKTQFDWFNEISMEYEIIELRQRFKVHDTEWNRNGRYLMNIFNLQIADHNRTSELREALEALPEIMYAEYDPVLRTFPDIYLSEHNDTSELSGWSYTPNDPLLLQQWAIEAIEAEMAWYFETGSRDIVIGIVDSGTKWNHPDLRANVWTNESAFPGITINWDTGEIVGGNGTEVIIGWDFAKGSDWWDLTEGNNPYQTHPGNQHGTHVAGCAAAVGDNGIGVAGPAYNVRIMNTKHSFTTTSTNSIINGYEGIIFAVNNGANIVNTSWGGPGGGETANEVVSYAKSQGVLVVSSAGNRNNEEMFYPAGAVDAFSVAATDRGDIKASFSSFGSFVDISAPGAGILSTYYSNDRVDNYGLASGTSMSGPILAGIAALVWSYYPDLTVDELKERLRRGADPIDHLNQPQHQGKLGAGRANPFNSLMYDRIPRIDFESIEQIALTGDDNTLNPGETLSFKIHLKNRANWLDGLPTTARIETDDPWVQIINSTVNYGLIPQGESRGSENSFIISVNDLMPIETHIEFTLFYLAEGGTGINYEYQVPFTILVSRNKDNWPLSTNDFTANSIIVFDLNQDGEKEIIFASQEQLFVMNSNKENLPGFPVTTNISNVNPITIIKSGNEFEIVLTGSNRIQIINKYGEIRAETQLDGNIMSSAVSYDVDGEGYESIAVGTIRGLLYLFNNDLTLRHNYPIIVGSPLVSLPIFVDINNDGQIDILVNPADRQLYSYTASTGETHLNSPINIETINRSGLVAATNGIDTFIYAVGLSSVNDNVKVFDQTGNLINSAEINGSTSILPIISDINDSGSLDFVVVTNSGIVYLFDGMLNLREGFPVSLGGIVTQHPILADVDNDGTAEIIVLVNDGSLHAIKYDGTFVTGFPYTFIGSWHSSPVYADVDGSGRGNFLMSNMSSVYYIDLPVSFNASQYPTHAYTRSRNSVYKSYFVNDYDFVDTRPIVTGLLGNYPNPFNPETKISFFIDEEKFNSANIEIFNIRGQRVETLSLSEGNIQNGYVVWLAEGMSSGVYFYRLMIDNRIIDVKRALLLK
ncbi:MAG: S8 family serine peptidase [Candidatus Cloacimonetes bacterium]|nr:S8 family serine peptidase [Candidatus Cloacimonadota bacterium]